MYRIFLCCCICWVESSTSYGTGRMPRQRGSKRPRSEELLCIEPSSSESEKYSAGEEITPDVVGSGGSQAPAADKDVIVIADDDSEPIAIDDSDKDSSSSKKQETEKTKEDAIDSPPSSRLETGSRRASSSRYFDEPDVSVKCHRCGEAGHYSYDCVSDTPLVKLCSTCGEPGHSFIHCTNRICYNCGQVGHISNNCTFKRVRGLNRYLHDLLPKIQHHYKQLHKEDISNTRCMSCLNYGHVNCASEEADSKIAIYCPRCGSEGHTIADHISNIRGGHPTRDTFTHGSVSFKHRGYSSRSSQREDSRMSAFQQGQDRRKKRRKLHEPQNKVAKKKTKTKTKKGKQKQRTSGVHHKSSQLTKKATKKKKGKARFEHRRQVPL